MGCPPSDTIVEPFSIFIFLPFIPFSDLFVSFVGDGFISILLFSFDFLLSLADVEDTTI